MAWALLLSALSHAVLVVLSAPATKITPAVSGMHFIFQARIGSSGEESTPKQFAHALPIEEQHISPSSAQGITPGLTTSKLVLPDSYYEVSELDTVPASQQAIEPQYPTTALASQISGEVQLEMLVDERGAIESLLVLESSPPGIFDQAAIDAFQDKKFEPGLRNGRPVKSRLKIMVHFSVP